uniref:Phlebovirus_G2 domain-containing protein n=1 Tax=Haemonchus contortus TaxID=6289 RepID=A0A7I4Z0U8_HAECO
MEDGKSQSSTARKTRCYLAIREVELMTSSKRKIRRPVNLLIPLEVQDSANDQDSANEFGDNPKDIQDSADPEHNEPTLLSNGKDPSATTHDYNLRPRPTRPKIIDAIATTSSSQRNKTFKSWFLFYLMIVSYLGVTATPHTPLIQMTCSDKGVLVSKAHNNVTFEICTDQSCIHYDDQERKVVATFPPEYTLQDYRVMLKWSTGQEKATVETVCRALDFCENIDCWFCLQVLCNPECWPIGAISVFIFSLYLVVTACYLLLYVPMTIGKPIRLILCGTYIILAWILSTFGRCILQLGRCITSGHKRSRRQGLLMALAVVLYITAVAPGGARACQLVEAFEHRLTVCSMSTEGQTCNITTTELLKLNAFKQEACLRILYNSSLISNIKVRWKGLYLSCEKETLYFTRPTTLKVLDSKRCAHTGSCIEEKCANINSSTLVRELEEANHYPGRTRCLELCGWLGCGCWYPSSRCLFYTVYAVPTAETIYEVFRCMRWSQQVKLLPTMEDFHHDGGKQQYELMVKPNIPVKLSSLRLTMTSVSLPPTPLLHSYFISNGHETSIWDKSRVPNLICISPKRAANLDCSVAEDCRCEPAESKVKCECSTIDVEKEFDHLEAKLPIRSPVWELSTSEDSTVTAKILDMVSADVTVNFQSTLKEVAMMVHNGHCSIEDADLNGCYSCSQGARSTVRCKFERKTLGEVICD